MSAVGLLEGCVKYSPWRGGCDLQCLSSLSAALGRTLDMDWGEPTEAERVRARANADYMERMATALRTAVSWVETGHNSHIRVRDKGLDDLLTRGMRRAARAKPDVAGVCNGGVCILGAARMVSEGVHASLTEAIGALELKRILKAAEILEENADNLRAAVVPKAMNADGGHGG